MTHGRFLRRCGFGGHQSSNGLIVVAWFAVWVGSACTAAPAQEAENAAILARVQLLLPQKEQDGAGPRSAETVATPKEPSAEELLWKDASTACFTQWTRYEDEFLTFSYPKDSRVRLEIKTPQERIPVAGSPVRSGGIDFFRCYRLTFRDETYCLLLLARTQEFDDGICLCGHIAFDKYLEHRGALYRFSLLGDGQIKRIQMLGEEMRLVLFEWTHLPISQEVYAAIALSVQLKRPVMDVPARRAKIEKAYGKSGFLEKGMDRDAVVALLGPPTEETPEELRYVSRESRDEPPGSDDEECTATVPLVNGTFVGLKPDWEQRRNLPPEANSVQWILVKLGARDCESLEVAREEELPALMERVVELLPTVNDRHWGELCEAVSLLAEREVKDPRVLPIVRQRYLDPQLSAVNAMSVLQEYGAEGIQELFAKRMEIELLQARTPEALGYQKDVHFGWYGLNGLLHALTPDCPQRERLILEAMSHPHAAVRVAGFRHARDLPGAQGREQLWKGLVDSVGGVRACCAKELSEMSASAKENAEDLARLQAQRAKETDPEAIEAFDRALKQLE